MLIKSALLALGLGASLGAAVTSLEIQGNSFVNPKTGSRFQIVGVAYQPGGSAGYKPDQGKDPLSDADACLRDAALMQVLGVNTIRVYNLDPNLNHDACASIFNAAGMYMILDVNSPLVGESLVTDQPWTSYYAAYLNRTFAVVEAFSNYPNTLAFFSGNEVISNVESAKYVPPYLRAVTRDLKSYIKQHISRQIPVGYSAADVRDVLVDTYNYLVCDDNGDGSNADLFALNSYSWCGNSDFHTSTYDQLVADFKNSPVPVFFSEYGCNKPAPRVFTEVGTLYGDQMNTVLSGGIVYEYAQEPNNYGLVNINDDGTAQLLGDYHTLAAQYKSLDFSKVEGGKPASSTPSTPKCDPSLITEQGFNNNFTIPAIPTSDDSAKILAAGVNPKPSGKLIDISNWSVKMAVSDVDGSQIKNLAVKQLASDQSNQPGLNTAVSITATPTGTGSAPTPTTSKGAAATGLPRPALAAMALPVAALLAI